MYRSASLTAWSTSEINARSIVYQCSSVPVTSNQFKYECDLDDIPHYHHCDRFSLIKLVVPPFLFCLYRKKMWTDLSSSSWNRQIIWLHDLTTWIDSRFLHRCCVFFLCSLKASHHDSCSSNINIYICIYPTGSLMYLLRTNLMTFNLLEHCYGI